MMNVGGDSDNSSNSGLKIFIEKNRRLIRISESILYVFFIVTFVLVETVMKQNVTFLVAVSVLLAILSYLRVYDTIDFGEIEVDHFRELVFADFFHKLGYISMAVSLGAVVAFALGSSKFLILLIAGGLSVSLVSIRLLFFRLKYNQAKVVNEILVKGLIIIGALVYVLVKSLT